jgi:hypothetical protein
MAKKSITKMDHPPYLPDLAPCNFYFFPKLKNALKGHRFANIPDIQHNVTARYSGKLFSRVFPAVASSSHKVQQLHKESISKVPAVASAHVSKFCFHRDIPGIKLSQSVHVQCWFYAGKISFLQNTINTD